MIYNSTLYDAMTGAIDFDTNAFKVMLVTSTYVPNKDTHLNRTHVTNEITGTGYTAGGNSATVTVTKDTANDRTDVSLGGTSWSASTITARGAVYYKSTGTAANDLLVAYIDFGSDVISTNGTFSLTASTLRLQN
jgi:hypothetical protein